MDMAKRGPKASGRRDHGKTKTVHHHTPSEDKDANSFRPNQRCPSSRCTLSSNSCNVAAYLLPSEIMISSSTML